MEDLKPSDFLLGSFKEGWRRWAAWLVCIGGIVLLATFRKETDAEFTFASLALLPVLTIAWVGGRAHGLVMAVLAAAMWAYGDIASGRQFTAPWVPWANSLTRLATYSIVAMLASQIRILLEREHQRAIRDALTGLQNRRAFLDAGASELERSKRYSHPLSVICLDLDDFKLLNDAKGHDVGDAALRATAKSLLGSLRSSDRVARLGGDEFAALLPEIGYVSAVDAGRKISTAVNGALRAFPPVKASIGVAWFGSVDRSFQEMLKCADNLMYEVKECGKGEMRARRFTGVDKSNFQ